jgi:hypothetical protein
MPAFPQTNEVLTQNLIRAFTQRGGPGVTNPLRYAGMEEQYLMVGDIANPVRGSINPINVNDPFQRGLFRRIGTTIEAADIPDAAITFKQRISGPPWYAFSLDCPINIYESEGQCGDPSDPKNGWTSMLILSNGIASDRTHAGRTPFDESEVSTTEVQFTWMGGVYPIGGIVLGEQAAVDVTTEVIDIVYYNVSSCGDCGSTNDGTKWLYALQQTAGGSSAVNGKVLYSTDSGVTWTASAITGLGVGVLVTAIAVVGSYLVVVAKSENAYYYSPINTLTGAPGAWTKITTGFVATKTPNDIYVQSPNRTYFVGDGGYVYLATDITAGVSVLTAGSTTTANLLRIHGNGRTLVAVGATNTIIKSINQGQSWAATTTTVTGTLQAVSVQNDYDYMVGTAAGGVSYTENAGETWTALTLPGAALVGIHDIVFASAEVGYIAATRAGPTGIVFRTTFGGQQWSEAPSSALPSAPTYGRPNRLAVPGVPNLGIAAGNLAVAGLGGGLVDGIILIGATPQL